MRLRNSGGRVNRFVSPCSGWPEGLEAGGAACIKLRRPEALPCARLRLPVNFRQLWLIKA